MDNKVKNVLLLVLVIGLVGMTSAYALLSTQFNINSTAKVTGATWDVHFDNLQDPTVTGTFNTARATDAAEAPASISGLTTINNLHATFNEPGGSVSYEFDVVNGGTLNAELVSFTKPEPTCTINGTTDASFCSNYITYTLVQKNGSAIANGHTLAANSTQTWVLTISSSLDQAHWPANDVTVSGMNISFSFQQAQ